MWGISSLSVMEPILHASETQSSPLDHQGQCVLASPLCLTLCEPIDCNPLGSSVHGILQARILEWVAMTSSRDSSQPRD